MTSMVKVVAKAICAEGSFCCQNTEAACNAMAWYEDAARAAIEAMAEPTERMVDEARRLNHPRDRDVWRTMIRAALEGERDGG